MRALRRIDRRARPASPRCSAGLIVWALLERAAAGRQADRAAGAGARRASRSTSSRSTPSAASRSPATPGSAATRPEAEDALRRALGASLVRGRLDVGTTWRGALSQDGARHRQRGPRRRARSGAACRRARPAMRLPGGRPVLSADGGVVAAIAAATASRSRATDGSGGAVRIAGRDRAGGQRRRALRRRRRPRRARRVRGRAAPAGRSRATARRDPTHAVLAFDPSDDGRLRRGRLRQGGPLTVWNWRDGGARTLPRAASAPSDAHPARRRPRPACSRQPGRHARGAVACWAARRACGTSARGRRIGLGPRRRAGGPRRRVEPRTASGSRSRRARSRRCSTAPAASCRARPARSTSSPASRSTRADGDLIVTASRDGVARVWDVQQRLGLLAELRGHTDEITDAAFTADGRGVVTLSLDGTRALVAGRGGPRDSGTRLGARRGLQPGRQARRHGGGRRQRARAPRSTGGPADPASERRSRSQTANSITFDPSGQRVAVAGGHDAAATARSWWPTPRRARSSRSCYPAGRDVLTRGVLAGRRVAGHDRGRRAARRSGACPSSASGRFAADRDARASPTGVGGRAGRVQPGRPLDRHGGQRRRRAHLRRSDARRDARSSQTPG